MSTYPDPGVRADQQTPVPDQQAGKLEYQTSYMNIIMDINMFECDYKTYIGQVWKDFFCSMI
jgi:hypothetical protein